MCLDEIRERMMYLKVKINMGKPVFAIEDYYSSSLRGMLHLPEVEHVRPVSISSQRHVALYSQISNH